MKKKIKLSAVILIHNEEKLRATSITKIPTMILSFLLSFIQSKKMCNEVKQK